MDVYLGGAEDSEFALAGGASVSTTSGLFRSDWADCALVTNPGTVKNRIALGETMFWFTVRWVPGAAIDASGSLNLFDVQDMDGAPLFRIRPDGAVWNVEKIDSGGTAHLIGTFAWSPVAASQYKLDLQVVNSTTGRLRFFSDNADAVPVQLFDSGAVDTTTDGLARSVGFVDLQGVAESSGTDAWSEMIFAADDTRALCASIDGTPTAGGLKTLRPSTNGATHSFDLGSPAAANVDEVTLDDTTFDGASVRGLLDQYTTNGLPSGSWSVAAVGISTRAWTEGAGPPDLALNVRIGSVDVFADHQTPGSSATNVQAWWEDDPTSGSGWRGLPANIGALTWPPNSSPIDLSLEFPQLTKDIDPTYPAVGSFYPHTVTLGPYDVAAQLIAGKPDGTSSCSPDDFFYFSVNGGAAVQQGSTATPTYAAGTVLATIAVGDTLTISVKNTFDPDCGVTGNIFVKFPN